MPPPLVIVSQTPAQPFSMGHADWNRRHVTYKRIEKIPLRLTRKQGYMKLFTCIVCNINSAHVALLCKCKEKPPSFNGSRVC